MRLTYLFDPLCGWCYGAEAMIQQVAARTDLTLAPVGLFAGANARPMDAAFASYAWANDQRIAQLSGQVFSEAYRKTVLGAVGDLFDSAPATLGLVATGLEAPSQELAALQAIQHARYVDGRDTSTIAVVIAVLQELGLDDAARRVRQPDAPLLETYQARIEAGRRAMARFGARGVPALIAEDESGARLIPSSALFGDADTLWGLLRAT